MVSKLASRLNRSKYILGRLRESPWKFLRLKAGIEWRKKRLRGVVMKAAASGRRFSGGYEVELEKKRALGAALRTDLVAEFRRLGHSDENLVAALAADFDAGRRRCLGYGDFVLRTGNWALDDFHNFAWPRKYFADINYVMADSRCDVKVPWEKSRMQWLCAAALASQLDADAGTSAKRVAAAMDLFEDWVQENPYGVGVNWISSMEVAIRAVNLLLTFSLLENKLEEAALKQLLVSAGEHLHYLRRFPETSDVQGNHYLATALGVYFLEEFAAPSDGPHDIPAQNFRTACLEQFSAEGLHIEFSPTYHRLSLDMVALGFSLMKRRRATVAAGLEPLLIRGVRVCCILANHGNELPVFGDNDSGMVIDFHQSARRFGAYGWLPIANHSVAAAARSSATLPEAMFGATLAGLYGNSVSTSSQIEVRNEITLLPPFAVMERGRNKLVVRAGALGLAGRASHDHDDALSFWYSIDGQDFLVEVGCPPYTRDKKERGECIASFSHNLLSAADGKRYGGAVGSVTMTMRGGPQGRARVSHADGVATLHTELVAGSTKVNPVQHERSFHFCAEDSLCIEDRASFVDVATFELRFHLAPEVDRHSIRIFPQRAEVPFGARRFVFEWSGSQVEKIVIAPYVCHFDYGASAAAACLVVTGPVQGSLEMRTLISNQAMEGFGAC